MTARSRVSEVPDVIDALRRATSALHDRLDGMPYPQRVLDATLRLEDYAAFLGSLVVVHQEVEALAGASREPSVQAVFRADGEALPALARDLAHLASLGVAGVVPPAAFDLAAVIRALGEHDPKALCGVLYVLEGSRLGGLVQAAALARVPGLEVRGRDYLAGAGARTRPAFRSFLARLESALSGDAAAAIRGAVTTFEGFQGIVSAVSGDGPRAA